MPHRISVVPQSPGVRLPNGWHLRPGDTGVVSDDDWETISEDEVLAPQLAYVEETTDEPVPPPSLHDLQVGHLVAPEWTTDQITSVAANTSRALGTITIPASGRGATLHLHLSLVLASAVQTQVVLALGTSPRIRGLSAALRHTLGVHTVAQIWSLSLPVLPSNDPLVINPSLTPTSAMNGLRLMAWVQS